jgi:hypothetical protein
MSPRSVTGYELLRNPRLNKGSASLSLELQLARLHQSSMKWAATSSAIRC